MGKSYEYTHEGVVQNVLRYARSLEIPEGMSKQLAERAARKADIWMKNKSTVTESDLRRVIGKELEIVSPDLAFAYRNHDKII